jgi:Flp pilus assembly protein TadB
MAAAGQRAKFTAIMHLFLAALAVLFIVLGFTGFALGGLPAILFWFLAALCLLGAWTARSNRQRQREDRAMRPPVA